MFSENLNNGLDEEYLEIEGDGEDDALDEDDELEDSSKKSKKSNKKKSKSKLPVSLSNPIFPNEESCMQALKAENPNVVFVLRNRESFNSKSYLKKNKKNPNKYPIPKNANEFSYSFLVLCQSGQRTRQRGNVQRVNHTFVGTGCESRASAQVVFEKVSISLSS